MKYTLLELVQRILESMDSDEVNSIADTTESLAVANIVKEAYNEIIAEFDLKETEGFFQLDASTDSNLPTVMYLPNTVKTVLRLKYNVGTSLGDFTLRELEYVPPVQFLEMVDSWDSDASWIGTQVIPFNGSNFYFKFRNDESPRYWTSPNDRMILMDAYDSSYESTLTSSRTYGYGSLIPSFQMVDNFIPLLDDRQFSLLLNKAKAQAFIEIKQTNNDRAEKKERKFTILAYKTQDSTDNRPAIYKRKGYGRR